MTSLAELATAWQARWPEALRAWGRFIVVHDPLLCRSSRQAAREGLTGSFAMFRLGDRSVVLDLQQVVELGLTDLPVEVLAHEVGHHVLCPADLADGGRLLSRVRQALPGFEQHAPMIANLYADLLINNRLQRGKGLRMAEVYRRLTGKATAKSALWTFFMRTCEILWAQQAGTLAPGGVPAATEGDAQLAARLARVYAADWLAGAGGFAVLCYRYLSEDSEAAAAAARLRVCVTEVADGAPVPGLTGAETDPIVHPALDPRVNDLAEPTTEPPSEEDSARGGEGQHREPFEYGELLRQLGLTLTDEQIAARYYRERATPHLVRFPVRTKRAPGDLLPEGHAQWDVGEPLEDVDWLATALRSPTIVPGVTTMRQLRGQADDEPPRTRPVDLDLYVDSSGSMPDPRSLTSYLTLAGAILALSAMRVGAHVQATLWSGKNDVLRTDGFVRDETAVLNVLTGYFGMGTAFPLHVLRDTYADGRRAERPTHIVVISDNGVDTMFEPDDERGTPGREVAATALAAAGAGGTLVLNLFGDGEKSRIEALSPGWDLHRVTDWADLVEFAAAFSKRHYERSTV
ncbi:VWA domain-containing protein [Labedaea rhizosphaerae]|uniref:VWA domain-containing protein n=1 Tax=Labedaea rhizosphaerae TaxID=598644 RepID=A0A4R6RT16_LABRH|nr:VWA domain-containing protein [Labedaea rhizosphaerae]TDP90011.1 hypothetical protein EV186_111137 [Labedaea rhizosphaerae]